MLSPEIIKNYENKIHLLESRCEQYAQAYDSLLAQIKELQRYRFGQKSERYIDPENPQLNLIDNNENKFAAADAVGATITDDVQVAAHARKKKNPSEKAIPVRIEVIPVPAEKKKTMLMRSMQASDTLRNKKNDTSSTRNS